MIEVYFFVAAPDDIAELRSFSSLPEDHLVDRVRVPGSEALHVLRRLLTQSDEVPQVVPVDVGDGAAILQLGRSVEDVLLSATDVELRGVGTRWANLPPWRVLNPNVFDLSETVVTLAANFRRVADPGRRLFAWLEPAAR